MSTPTTAVSSGMQVLLDAEKEANRQVQAARQCNIIQQLLLKRVDRVQRLKDARCEGQAEIEALKQSKNAEYQAYEKNILGSLDSSVQEYSRLTEDKLVAVRETCVSKKGDMVNLLVDAVCKVEPEMHCNAVLRDREGN